MHRVRSGKVGLLHDLLRLYNLMELGRTLIGGVYDVDAVGALARDYQVATVFAPIAVTGAASVPAEVMQLITYVRHRGTVDYLGVGRGLRIYVHRSQVIRLLDVRSNVQGDGVERLLGFGFHGLLGRSIARPAG